MKKYCLLLLMLLLVCIFTTGCTIFPHFYKKSKVKKYAKGLISEDIKYKKCRRYKNEKILFFEDEEGREFYVETYYVHNSGVSGVELPGYNTYVSDAYQRCIFLQNRDKIKEILNETGYDWNIWDEEILDEDFDVKKEAKSGSYFPIHITKSDITPDEFGVIAHAVVQIDELLHYHYNYQYDEEVYLSVKRGGGFEDIYMSFAEIGGGVSIVFSMSDDERWTEKEVYDYLLKHYNEKKEKYEQYIEGLKKH